MVNNGQRKKTISKEEKLMDGLLSQNPNFRRATFLPIGADMSVPPSEREIEFAVPQSLLDAYNAFFIPADIYRGEYGVGSVDNPAFMAAASQFTDVMNTGTIGGGLLTPYDPDTLYANIGGKTGLTPARKQGIRREAERKKTFDFDSTYGNAPDRDYDRVTDVPIETRDFIELDDLVKTENIEPLLGETLLPVVWDRLATGRELVKYGDTTLTSPEPLFGGIRYPLLPQSTVLASTEPAVRITIAPAAKRVKELTGKDPIITNVVMAGSGVDFATPTLQTYIKSLPSANITKEGAEKIKAAIIKSDKGKQFSDIPLVTETEKFADYVSKLGGTQRAHLVKRLDQRGVVDAGSPNITSIRRAITDDDLLYEMPSQSGNMFSRLDADKGLLFDPEIPNPSYNAVMEGQSLLGLERSVPASILFRPFYLSKYMDEAGEFLPSATTSASGKQNFYDANKVMDALKKIMPMSEVDDQMLDEINFYNSLFKEF